MKLVIMVLVSLISSNVIAEELRIFTPSLGSNLIKKIVLYKDSELKSEAGVEITKEGILQNGKLIKFVDISPCKKIDRSSDSCLDDDYPKDFIRKDSSGGISLIVSQKDKDILTFGNKVKIYAHLTVEYFKNRNWPDYSKWKSYSGEEAKNYFKNLYNTDEKIKDLLSQISQCISKKDIDCLKKHTSDVFVQAFKYRQIAEDPALCKSFEPYAGDAEWAEMDEFIKEKNVGISDIVWGKLEEALSVDNPKALYSVNAINFGEKHNVSIELKSNQKLKCLNTVDLEVSLSNDNSRKEWRLANLVTYSSSVGKD